MNNKALIAVVSLPVNNTVTHIPSVPVQTVEHMLDEIRGNPLDLILFPQYTVLEEGNDRELEKIELFRSFARDNGSYVVYNSLRQSVTGASCTSTIIGRDGTSVGEYTKTHQIDGIDITLDLGDEMPVFQLDFGNVALLVGSDIYMPELSEIYSLKGAEILLCSMGTQILRDDTELQRLYKGRAIQNYLYVAASTYASSSIMYMASNFENFNPHAEEIAVSGDADASFNAFGLGKHTGRAGVCDLRGETIVSTGRESGVAVCTLDLTKKRSAASYNYGTGRIVFQQNERGVFRYLRERATYPSKLTEAKPGGARAKIGFVHLPYKDTIHTKNKNWHVNVLTHIREAAASCDLVVCSEYSRGDGGKDEEECLPDFLRGCSEIAKENNCYVAVNDVVQRMNTSLLFSRTGELIHQYQKVNTLSMMYHNQPPAGTEIDVVELDFGTVGFMVCADSYCQEIPRILALKGAELIILQSQSWGYDANAINEGASRTWAIENCQYVLMSNFPSSQIANRSNLIDPTGETVFASNYDMEGIYIAEINLDAVGRKVSFVLHNGKVRKDYTLRSRLMNARRPDLYSLLSQ